MKRELTNENTTANKVETEMNLQEFEKLLSEIEPTKPVVGIVVNPILYSKLLLLQDHKFDVNYPTDFKSYWGMPLYRKSTQVEPFRVFDDEEELRKYLNQFDGFDLNMWYLCNNRKLNWAGILSMNS